MSDSFIETIQFTGLLAAAFGILFVVLFGL